MKVLITFGQGHIHKVDGKVFDKDCVAEITAPSHEDARDIAVQAFGLKFCTSYDKDTPRATEMMQYYPRGIIPLN